MHNDVARVMTGFDRDGAAALAIAEAGEVDGWSSSVDGPVASWDGGELAFETAEDFTLTLEAPSEPQPVTLDAEQRYPGDGALRWPVELTVVPGDEASSAGYVWVVVALGGLSRSLGARRCSGDAARHFKSDSGTRCYGRES